MWILVLLILALILLLLFRTVTTKPTAAKTAEIKLENSERAIEYGKKLSTLVQKETVSSRFKEDRSKFYGFHDTLEKMFPYVHHTCEKKVFHGSLLFCWKGTGEKEPIMFMSHHDVVEAGGVWKHGAFSGDIDEQGRVWGRGTVDTKASLFCMLTAVEELIAEGYQPPMDIYIASSCTEEWSGEGAPVTCKYLKGKGVKLRLLLDEGGMILKDPIAGVKGIYGLVGVVEKGYGDIKFIAKSNGGHASAPKKNTPLVRLGRFMAEVDKKDPFTTKITPVVREMFERLAPNMDFGMKFIFTNMWFFEPLLVKFLPSISSAAGAMIKTTIAFTTAQGSSGLNVLPQEAYVTGNMRFIQHQPTEESIKLISDIAGKYDIKTEVIYKDSPCPIVDFKGEQFKIIEKAAAKVYPEVGISPYVMTGGTDAKFYTDICDNCLRFAPLYIDTQQYESIHGLNENIYQGALPFGVDFYKEVIRLNS